jgi:hypothetical protein
MDFANKRPARTLQIRAAHSYDDVNLPIPVDSEFDTSPEVVPLNPPLNRNNSVFELRGDHTPTVTSPESISSSGSGLRSVSKLRNFLSSRAKSSKSRPSPTATPLPRFVSYCFTASRESLLLWKRNGQSIVNVNVSTHDAKSFDLTNAIPTMETDKSLSIRLVAAGSRWICVVVLRKQVCNSLICRS